MRNTITLICLAVAAAVLFSCASISDSTDAMDTNPDATTAETGTTPEANAAENNTTSADIDTTADNKNKMVSADNSVGRAQNCRQLFRVILTSQHS